MNGKTPRLSGNKDQKSVNIGGTFMNLSGEGLKSR